MVDTNKINEIIKHFEDLKTKHIELEDLVSRVEVMTDNKLFSFYMSQKKKIEESVIVFDKYISKKQQANDIMKMIEEDVDDVSKEDFVNEYYKLKEEEHDLWIMLEDDYFSNKCDVKQNVVIEIVSDDFVAQNEIKTIFENFAKSQNCKNVSLSTDNSKTTLSFSGVGAYVRTQMFSGVYKIKNGSQESKATVSVLTEANQNIEFDLADLKIETLRSSGAGGQHINKTESAVRVVHLPTGISVKCQDERSQTQNKERALELIKEKILQKNAKNKENYIKNQRKSLQKLILSEKVCFEVDINSGMMYCALNKKHYNLNELKQGKLSVVSNDLMTE